MTRLIWSGVIACLAVTAWALRDLAKTLERASRLVEGAEHD